MRVRFRRYCYYCRKRFTFCSKRGQHMWLWDYYIYCDKTRLLSRGQFKTYERALASAQRAWKKLENTPCICRKETDGTPESNAQHGSRTPLDDAAGQV